MKGSSSKLQLWRRCKRKGFYHDVMKLKRITNSIAPARGTIIHQCLQNLYSGGDWTAPIRDFTPDLTKVFDEEREEWVRLQEELYRILRGYVVAYRDLDAKHTTLGTEIQFSLKLGDYEYMGTIDRLYADENNVVWVQDHKTVKIIPDEKELYLDMQTLLYFKACQQCDPLRDIIAGRKLGGVVFNHIKTKAPKEPLVLKSGGLSKAACDTDIATYFSAVRKYGLNPEDYKDMLDKLAGNVFFKRTRIPVNDRTLDQLAKEAIVTMNDIQATMDLYDINHDSFFFPRTMLKNRCSWDCEYYNICVSELAGMNVEGLLTSEYEAREDRYDDTIEE